MNEHYDYENGSWNSFPEVPFKVKVNEDDEKLPSNEIYTVIEVDDDADENRALFTLGEETKEELYFAFRFKPIEEDNDEPTLTPAQKLGYKVGDKFLERKPEYFNSGTVITLIVDDGSECPSFSDNEGDNEDDGWYLELEDVIPYTPKQEVQEGDWVLWAAVEAPIEVKTDINVETDISVTIGNLRLSREEAIKVYGRLQEIFEDELRR
jgi:hypothetical protein